MNWSAIATFLADADERPTFVVDGDGVVRLCNRALERLIGRSRRDVVGQPWHALVDPCGREKVGRALRAVRRGAARRCEIPLRTPSAPVTAELVLHPVGAEAVGFMAIGAAGDHALDRLVRDRLEELADLHQLSEREREVLDHLVRGRTVEEIGGALGISPRTAKFHQANVLDKLGLASRVELMRVMLEPGR